MVSKKSSSGRKARTFLPMTIASDDEVEMESESDTESTAQPSPSPAQKSGAKKRRRQAGAEVDSSFSFDGDSSSMGNSEAVRGWDFKSEAITGCHIGRSLCPCTVQSSRIVIVLSMASCFILCYVILRVGAVLVFIVHAAHLSVHHVTVGAPVNRAYSTVRSRCVTPPPS